jgi:hypothetical protein
MTPLKLVPIKVSLLLIMAKARQKRPGASEV